MNGRHTINMNNTNEAPGGRLSPDSGLEGVQARVKEATVNHRQEKEVNSKASATP